jgi:hypothetical protein
MTKKNEEKKIKNWSKKNFVGFSEKSSAGCRKGVKKRDS